MQKAIPMDQPYEFVFEKEIEGVFSNGVAGWKSFYEKYPDSGGYNELSAVGFNSDKTVAVVYVAHFCGGLCGGGGFHVLEKKEGKFVVLVGFVRVSRGNLKSVISILNLESRNLKSRI